MESEGFELQQEMDDDQKAVIVRALYAINPDPKCLFCGQGDMTFHFRFGQLTMTPTINFGVFPQPPTLSLAVLTCTRCGFVHSHWIDPLGLDQSSESSKAPSDPSEDGE